MVLASTSAIYPLKNTSNNVLASNDGDAQTFLLFVKNLDNNSLIRLFTGCLKIPFNIDLRQKVRKIHRCLSPENLSNLSD